MASIGFQRSDSKEPKQELTLQGIEKTIAQEILNLAQYETIIRKELTALEDLQHNFKKTELFVESIEKLIVTREETIQKLRFATTKRTSEINLNVSQELLQIIHRLGREIGPMIQSAGYQMSKLFIEETHLLYAANKETKKMMDILNEEARKLTTAIRSQETRFNGTSTELDKISQELQKIQVERILKPQPNNKIEL